jgi:hypothetical protein
LQLSKPKKSGLFLITCFVRARAIISRRREPAGFL